MGSECFRSQCKYLLLCCLQRKIYRIVMAVQMESGRRVKDATLSKCSVQECAYT